MVLVMPKGRWITINHYESLFNYQKWRERPTWTKLVPVSCEKGYFGIWCLAQAICFVKVTCPLFDLQILCCPRKKLPDGPGELRSAPLILVPFWLVEPLFGSLSFSTCCLVRSSLETRTTLDGKIKKKTCAKLTFFSFISNYIPWHPCYICIYIYIPLYPHSIPIISPWYLHGIPILSPMKYPNESLLLHVARHGFGWGFAGHEPGRHRNPWWFRGNIYRNCVIDGYDLGISHNLWYHIFLGYSSLYSGKLMSITEDHGDLEVHL